MSINLLAVLGAMLTIATPLLLAALDYSLEKTVVYVAARPPRSRG